MLWVWVKEFSVEVFPYGFVAVGLDGLGYLVWGAFVFYVELFGGFVGACVSAGVCFASCAHSGDA